MNSQEWEEIPRLRSNDGHKYFVKNCSVKECKDRTNFVRSNHLKRHSGKCKNCANRLKPDYKALYFKAMDFLDQASNEHNTGLDLYNFFENHEKIKRYRK